MRHCVASRIMRTTIDIDDPILKEIKRLRRREGKSMGRLVSDLLAHALAGERGAPKGKATFSWVAKPMGARVDLGDMQALHDAMDGPSK
jgi:Ribbon-helix-helix protein, copG family